MFISLKTVQLVVWKLRIEIKNRMTKAIETNVKYTCRSGQAEGLSNSIWQFTPTSLWVWLPPSGRAIRLRPTKNLFSRCFFLLCLELLIDLGPWLTVPTCVTACFCAYLIIFAVFFQVLFNYFFFPQILNHLKFCASKQCEDFTALVKAVILFPCSQRESRFCFLGQQFPKLGPGPPVGTQDTEERLQDAFQI